ncbi:MAG: hypothetical protein CK429_01445 [Mycobacterium sp.]|nr:MAG: hypothetical protein CK429_01445 [Mycobacterium sp.]
MYNNSATIARCLRSILDQKGVNFEVVVVDDDSTDDGATIAGAMLRPQDRLVRNAPRLGLNQNHNKCLDVARGELIQFVHGDDWLLPGALQTLADCFDEPSVGMAFAPRRVVTDDEDFRRQYGVLHTHFRSLQTRNRGASLVQQIAARGGLNNWIGEPTSVMFRRQLGLAVGGFRDDVYQLVDLDFWLRLMLRCTVAFVPQELSVRSHTAATESARNLSMRRYWLDQLRILTWLTMDPSAPAGTRIIASLWWLPAWLSLLQAVLWGPERWYCFRTFCLAPLREFSRARQLRRDLPGRVPVAAT